jgi:hypothetical protein
MNELIIEPPSRKEYLIEHLLIKTLSEEQIYEFLDLCVKEEEFELCDIIKKYIEKGYYNKINDKIIFSDIIYQISIKSRKLHKINEKAQSLKFSDDLESETNKLKTEFEIIKNQALLLSDKINKIPYEEYKKNINIRIFKISTAKNPYDLFSTKRKYLKNVKRKIILKLGKDLEILEKINSNKYKINVKI